MSMNQYMHPRNIYKQPPNFKQLAIEYPEFRKYVVQDLNGKVTFDFKNLQALRALTCTLLKKDFGIDLEIPITKLIPTVPLRLNYILWIEDLMCLLGRSENINGIDIGTGASCIYPLMAAKKNKWTIIASEIDPESINFANSNIKKNHLEDFIKVVEVKGETLLDEVLENYVNDYDFCMCNPPFFSSAQELHPFFKARKQNRPHPKNAFCASVDEVVSKGGEVEYISKLIHESKRYQTKIKIYTTMIGHKSSLPPLKKLLREIEVVSFKHTEFCQGNTTRWGLAWTFLDVDLRKIPDSLIAAKQKQSKPFLYEIPKSDDAAYKLSVINEKLLKVLKQLQINYQEVKHVKHMIEYIITAYSDTWSHQRRKKRERLRLNSTSKTEETNNHEINNSSNTSSEGSEVHETCDKLAEVNISSVNSSLKRGHDEEDDSGFYNVKKIKTVLDECAFEKIYLKAMICLVKVEDCIGLELTYLEGSGTKDALHRVLQFIKNNMLKIT